MLKMMNSGATLPRVHANAAPAATPITIQVYAENVRGIQQWPQVKQKRYYFIPLLVFTEWNSRYDCQVGFKDLQENLAPNLNIIFSQHLKESPLADTSSIQNKPGPYSLEISIDEVKSHIPYINRVTTISPFVFYITMEKKGVEDAIMALTSTYTLKQNGTIVKQNTVTTSHSLAPVTTPSDYNKKKFMRSYLDYYFAQFNQLLENHAWDIIDQLEGNS